MKATDLKVKITAINDQLEQARRDAESLPERAGIAAANGNETEADDLFAKAEQSSLMVRRLTATLDALQYQYAEEIEKERRQEAEKRLADVSRLADKQSDRLERAAANLAKAWNEFVVISCDDPDVMDMSGGKILSRLFTVNPPVQRDYLSGLPLPAKDFDEQGMRDVIKSFKGSTIIEVRRNLHI